MQEVSIKDLAKHLRKLSSTALAILPAPLHMSYLKRQQSHNLCLRRDYHSKVALDLLCREELNWWILKLSLRQMGWEVSNFSPGRTVDTVRYIKDKLV